MTVATATIAIATTATRFQLFLMCTVLSPLIRTIDFVCAADAHPDGRGSAGVLRLSQMDCTADTLKPNPMNLGVGRNLKHLMWPSSRVKGPYRTFGYDVNRSLGPNPGASEPCRMG